MRAFVLGLALAFAATATRASAASYSFTTISFPGAIDTWATDINDAGQIVGSYDDGPNATTKGFLKDGDTYTTIEVPLPGVQATFAEGINDAGLIVGSFADFIGRFHGFAKDGDTYTVLDVPGAPHTYASGVNDSEQIVGYFDANTPGLATLGFLKEGATYDTIQFPGASNTVPLGINDAGQIVGGFGLTSDGVTYTAIDVPGARSSIAVGINDGGQVVGYFNLTTGPFHGFLKDGDTYTTLDVPGDPLLQNTQAFGINNLGQIVGAWTDDDEAATGRGFLATPVPEPPLSRVQIDIKPGAEVNPINVSSKGVIPVAILGSESFDVAQVDVTTLAFGPGGATPSDKGSHLEDINADGFADLVLHYRTQETGIASDATDACVTGELLNGTTFEGCDAVQIRPTKP